MVRNIIHAILGQCPAQVWRSYKSCVQMIKVLFQTVKKSLTVSCKRMIRSKPHEKCHRISGHCIDCKTAGWCIVLFHERIINLSCQSGIIICIILFTKHSCSLRDDIRRIIVVCRGYKSGLSRAVNSALYISVKRQPVAIMRSGEPQTLSAVRVILALHIVDPALHAVVLFNEDALVSGMKIHIPRNYRCRISPCRGSISRIMSYRNHIRHASVQLLLLHIQIVPEFGIEGICIHKIGSSP